MSTTKSLLFAILLTVFSFAANAQTKLTTYVERTHVSPKFGTSISYEFGDYTEIGIFYQKAVSNFNTETGHNINQEDEFKGVLLAYPLYVGEITVWKLNARTGMVNNQNFLITPSVTGSYYPTPFLSLDLGVGVRNFRPTLQAGLKITIR